MKILIVGGGGREHTLAWKLSKDSCRPELFCAPGNAGTSGISVNLDIAAEDVGGLLEWAKKNKPDLTVIGPEAPLCEGLTDLLQAEGLRVFGPSKAAARMEGSKLFAKEVMLAAGVPTAKACSFVEPEAAIAYIRKEGVPLVIKADGLAAGKGVYICDTLESAETAIKEIMIDKFHGDSGNMVVVEECLVGEEASILALVDGQNVVMLASSQDHKRVYNNDEGPNTGGMGAYSPAPVVSEDMWPMIKSDVFERTLVELKKRGIVYKGILYAGLMMTETGPKVLEFNCRFGDPETQVVIPRIEGDLVPALQACVDGTLHEDMIKWRSESCVCVVMASGGYPGPYEKNKIITGLEDISPDGAMVFHAGTRTERGKVLTAGGRVLGVVALGEDLKDSIRRVYLEVSKICFDQAQYRTDIGAKAVRRM